MTDADPAGPELAYSAAAAADPGRQADERTLAARFLATEGDPRGFDLLAAMAADQKFGNRDPETGAPYTGAAEYARRTAAETLAALEDPRGADLLAAMVVESGLGAWYRYHAARSLHELGDRRGVELLAAWAGDVSCDVFERRRTAEELDRLGDARGARLLAEMAADPDGAALEAESHRRYFAIPENRDGAAAVAADLASNLTDRIIAARVLLAGDDPRGASVLTAIAEDRNVDAIVRSIVAGVLSDAGIPGPLAVLMVDQDVLGAIAAAWPEDPGVGLAAARRLAELGHARGIYLLAAMAGDSALPAGIRRSAVRRLADLGEACGEPLLAAMAAGLGEAAAYEKFHRSERKPDA